MYFKVGFHGVFATLPYQKDGVRYKNTPLIHGFATQQQQGNTGNE